MDRNYLVESSGQSIVSYRPIRQWANLPGGIIVVIKVFFDGTGGNGQSLGLGGIGAPLTTWELFESEWDLILRHYDAPLLHMTDLNTGRKLYRAWDKTKRRMFLRDLLLLIFELFRNQHTCARMTFIPGDVYIKAKKDYPSLIPPSACLCTYWCLDQICKFYSTEDSFEIVFDINESFARHLHKHLGKKTFVEKHSILSRVDTLKYGSADKIWPLQTVDIFVWALQRLWLAKDFSKNDLGSILSSLDASILLLKTKNKRWEYEDFEYLVECRMSSNKETRKHVEIYDLCT
jgi:hypothetical protein